MRVLGLRIVLRSTSGDHYESGLSSWTLALSVIRSRFSLLYLCHDAYSCCDWSCLLS